MRERSGNCWVGTGMRNGIENLGLMITAVTAATLFGCQPPTSVPSGNSVSKKQLGQPESILQSIPVVPAGGKAEPKDTELDSGAQGKSISSPKIEMVALNSGELKGWMAKQSADLVLVDYWATWCIPCVEKLPKLVELDLKYRGSGLVVIGVSMDEPGDVQQVSEFLAARGVTFAQAIRRDGPSEAFEDFDLDAIPVYRLFRPNGELLETFAGEFTMEQIETAIRKHLR